jgi:Ca-activated chloride channel family protein
VENSGDLPRIFAAELGDVLSVVARDVTINIDIAGGAKPIRIIGRDGRIKGNTVELKLNQLYGGQQKYALVEVEVPRNEDGASVQIASATCDYDNVITKKRDRSSGSTDVRFSIRPSDVAGSLNAPVVEEVYYNVGAEAQDQSIVLWESGMRKDAVDNLRRQSAAIKEKAAELKNEDLDDYADRLNAQAAELEEEGLTKRGRKALRSESFQIEMQQKTKQ